MTSSHSRLCVGDPSNRATNEAGGNCSPRENTPTVIGTQLIVVNSPSPLGLVYAIHRHFQVRVQPEYWSPAPLGSFAKGRSNSISPLVDCKVRRYYGPSRVIVGEDRHGRMEERWIVECAGVDREHFGFASFSTKDEAAATGAGIANSVIAIRSFGREF